MFTFLSGVVSFIIILINWISNQRIREKLDALWEVKFNNLYQTKYKELQEVISKLESDLDKTQKESESYLNQIKLLNQVTFEAHSKSKDIESGLGRYSMLWVDDKPSNNDSLISLFTDNGISVEISKDTIDALELCEKKRYNVIITDLERSGNPEAGIEFLNQFDKLTMRRGNIALPKIVVYTSPYTPDWILNKVETLLLNLI